MASLTHYMEWLPELEIYRCRSGACTFELTMDQMGAAGYAPTTFGVIFIDEDDFPEEENNDNEIP